MRILIDIGHPAHLHIFRNFAKEMQKEGHEILFTCRDKEFEIKLLKQYGFEYKNFGKKYKTVLGKIFGLVKFDILEILTALKFKPDLFLSAGSMYAAHAAYVLRKPHYTFEDTFNMEQVKLYLPFTQKIFVSSAGYPDTIDKSKLIVYDGYHELAYLHPNRFKPDSSVLKELGLKENEKFALVRFVSWNATHDAGQSGIKTGFKEKFVKELSKNCKLFISSEGNLPKSLKKFQLNINPHKIHDLMAYATLFIGEGATMASECAVLGTPAIFINTINAYTIDEQEKYGLLFHYDEPQKALKKALEILNMENSKEYFLKKRDIMLKEKIDVTQFLLDFIKSDCQLWSGDYSDDKERDAAVSDALVYEYAKK